MSPEVYKIMHDVASHSTLLTMTGSQEVKQAGSGGSNPPVFVPQHLELGGIRPLFAGIAINTLSICKKLFRSPCQAICASEFHKFIMH